MLEWMRMFQGRKLLIATKHQKERVIAPILEKELGVHCVVNRHFDTDTLGTFSGEIERTFDPIATAREKCLRAMALSGTDLGIASEGSFGMHPTLFFIPADEEFLIFIDSKNGIEVVVRELSTSTNHNGKSVRLEEELIGFAASVGFPQHGLIMRKSKDDNKEIRKGITTYEELHKSFQYFITLNDSVYVETDMRAMYNPTRMEVIKQATHKLLANIKLACSNCQMPGFGVTDVKAGLPCKECGMPTHSVLSYLYVCKHCGFEKEVMYPNQKTSEDPMYCNYCNP